LEALAATTLAGVFLWEVDLETMQDKVGRPVIRMKSLAGKGNDARVGHFLLEDCLVRELGGETLLKCA
jgi:hypothetical protein